MVSADASVYELGAVLWQQHEGVMKPIAYASRTLSKAELGKVFSKHLGMREVFDIPDK